MAAASDFVQKRGEGPNEEADSNPATFPQCLGAARAVCREGAPPTATTGALAGKQQESDPHGRPKRSKHPQGTNHRGGKRRRSPGRRHRRKGPAEGWPCHAPLICGPNDPSGTLSVSVIQMSSDLLLTQWHSAKMPCDWYVYFDRTATLWPSRESPQSFSATSQSLSHWLISRSNCEALRMTWPCSPGHSDVRRAIITARDKSWCLGPVAALGPGPNSSGNSDGFSREKVPATLQSRDFKKITPFGTCGAPAEHPEHPVGLAESSH